MNKMVQIRGAKPLKPLHTNMMIFNRPAGSIELCLYCQEHNFSATYENIINGLWVYFSRLYSIGYINYF